MCDILYVYKEGLYTNHNMQNYACAVHAGYETSNDVELQIHFGDGLIRAYSNDIRWRMVHQRCILALSYTTIANNLNVDLSTVHRTVKLFEETGGVYSIQGYHESIEKSLTSCDKFAILESVVETPLLYLSEIQQDKHRYTNQSANYL